MIFMSDKFEPVSGYVGEPSCIYCIHFDEDVAGVPWYIDFDFCSRNYDQPCGGLPICEE